MVSCLRGVPTYAVPLDAELVTPTGAAIVATVAERFERWPSFAVERVGWGGGRRELPDRPNLLRAVLGESEAPRTEASHAVLEANVDDMTGELAGHALRVLLEAGALDAWGVPILMKKGRPGLTLAVLTTHDEPMRWRPSCCARLRRWACDEPRSGGSERPRRVISVATKFGPIAVKVSSGPFGPPVMKPEFDACVRAASAAGVTVRQVIDAALEAASHLESIGTE